MNSESSELTEPNPVEPNPFPRPEKKATLKLGQRELSLLSIGVVALVSLGLLVGGYRTYKNFKSQRDIVLNQSNIRSILTALQLYAQDYEGRLPPADHWIDSISGYISVPQGTPGGLNGVLTGPGDDGTVGYVYNDDAAEYNLEPKPAAEDRQRLVLPKYLPLVIERENAPRNAHEKLGMTDTAEHEREFAKSLQFPHYKNDPDNAKTLILFANGSITNPIRRDFK